jgi:hypothetical protein
VTVGTDDEIARGYQPSFDDDLVTDALTYLEHRRAMPRGKVADAGVEGARRIVSGGE